MRTMIAAAVLAVGLSMTGCSSSEPGGSPASQATPSAASPEASMIGPIIVEPSQTEVEATVGRFLVFDVGDDPGRWDISSDDEAVVSVQRGGQRDGATFNPGGQALKAGEATVTLTDTGSGDALEFRITVGQ